MVEGVISVRVPRQEVCCCTARSWALIIGWFQIITSVIGSILIILDYIGVFVLFSKTVEGGSNQESGIFGIAFVSVAIIQIVILIGLGLLLFVGGIVLVIGVSQGSSSKLQCWLIIEGIFFALEILEFIMKLGSSAYGEVVAAFISILISLFCVWVVNLHRKELMRPVGRIGIPI